MTGQARYNIPVYILPGRPASALEIETSTIYRLQYDKRIRRITKIANKTCTDYTYLCTGEVEDISNRIVGIRAPAKCRKIRASNIWYHYIRLASMYRLYPANSINEIKQIIQELGYPTKIYIISKKEICKGIESKRYKKITGYVLIPGYVIVIK